MSLIENHWYIACPLRKFSNPLGIRICDHRIVVFRDATGELRALRDLCPHRNVQLSLGKVTPRGLECCYHGWTFDGCGNCTYIPSLSDEGKIPPKSLVRSYPVTAADGYIWVFIGGTEPAEKPFSMPHYGEKGWRHTCFDTTIANSIDNIVENFVDCPHTGYIHGGLFRTPATHEAKNEITVTPRGVEIEIYEDTQRKESLLSRILVGKDAEVVHIDRFFLPSIVQVSYSFGDWHIIGVQTCVPITPFFTHVYVYVTWNLGWLTHLAAPFVPWIGRYILRQDIAILENQGRQIEKYGRDFCSVPADAANNAIVNLRRCAAAGQPPDEDQLRRKQVSFRL